MDQKNQIRAEERQLDEQSLMRQEQTRRDTLEYEY